ncbi:MAG: YIP1 family protein [Nanoarchaeota archaeon]|nr:YIP1 family protein [Nanoarchaeota archaeon]
MLRETVNDLYLDPVRTIKRLRLTSLGDFFWPLLFGGLILGLSVELKNLNNGLYVGLTWTQALFMLIGGLVITLTGFFVLFYLLPLMIYKFEFMIFNVNDHVAKFAYVMALLAPLYSVSVLARVLLDVFLPEHAIFKFIELLVPSVAQLYAVGVLFVALRYYFKLDNVRAFFITALPWILMLIYSSV